ncbi:MAG: carboxymuconolactone decarboxylase family protein [Chloroflexi bacterium]|nr:carboxymuconolactone decarboxylase family protein [Chloroflexota bacterium]
MTERSEAYKRGEQVRRQLLGDEYFEKSMADPVMRKFTEVTVETLWSVLWTRPGLDMRTKTLICVVSDAATGRHPELKNHIKLALNHGWTQDELLDVFVHLYGYVGAPLTREAFLIAKEVFETGDRTIG